LDWARSGPPMAVVHGVQMVDVDGEVAYDSFEVLY
jgi:hypothetical protein